MSILFMKFKVGEGSSDWKRSVKLEWKFSLYNNSKARGRNVLN